jgi:hypothetical protein
MSEASFMGKDYNSSDPFLAAPVSFPILLKRPSSGGAMLFLAVLTNPGWSTAKQMSAQELVVHGPLLCSQESR